MCAINIGVATSQFSHCYLYTGMRREKQRGALQHYFLNNRLASLGLSTQGTCKLRYLSYCGTSLRKASWHKSTVKPFIQSYTVVLFLSLGHSSDSGGAKVPLGGETVDNHMIQGRACMKDSEKFPTT
jgi:hypothetical protein